MNGLAGHLADAIAEAAEEHLHDLTPAGSYFYVKRALESVAKHVADVVCIENLHDHDDEICPDTETFIKACHIGRSK